MMQMDVGDPVHVVYVYVVVVVIFEGGNKADAPPVEALPHFV